MPESYFPGDVVLVPFPFTDLSSAKSRPALVLSNEAFNRGSADLIVCTLTSNLANAAHSVLIGPQDMESGKLLGPCRAKVGKVATLQKSLVHKRVGRVKAATLAHVMHEFEAVFT